MPEPACQKPKDIGINFNTGHMTLPEGQGSQDVPAASYSNHKNRRGVSQVMCKRRHIVFEMLDGVQISVEFRDHCCRTGIDIQIELAALSLRTIPGAQSPLQLRGETDSARQSEKQAKVGKHRVRFALLHQLDENRPGSETKHRQ